MIAQVSKVYTLDNKFRFFAILDENSKGYEFDDIKSANKARAKFIRLLKSEGVKIYSFVTH